MSPNGDSQVPERRYFDFAGRLKTAAKKKGWGVTELAGKLGVARGTLNRYWAGDRLPSADLLFEMADALEVTARYLIEGRSDPSSLSDRRATYRSETDDEGISRGDEVQIAEIDLRWGLGATYIDGPAEAQKRTFSRQWLRQFTRADPEQLFWTIGDGDSMEPTIRSGEVILIDASQQTPRFGDGIWAVAIGEIGMIKRLHFSDGKVQLLSDNQLVPPAIAGDDELHIVGRVLAVVRRL